MKQEQENISLESNMVKNDSIYDKSYEDQDKDEKKIQSITLSNQSNISALKKISKKIFSCR